MKKHLQLKLTDGAVKSEDDRGDLQRQTWKESSGQVQVSALILCASVNCLRHLSETDRHFECISCTCL